MVILGVRPGQVWGMMVTTPWTQPGRGLFSISFAAQLTGLHPQTLRIYEREGLLDPARSPGGTRRYSTDDIGLVHQIMALTSDGLNLAGIRRVLELQEESLAGCKPRSTGSKPRPARPARCRNRRPAVPGSRRQSIKVAPIPAAGSAAGGPQADLGCASCGPALSCQPARC